REYFSDSTRHGGPAGRARRCSTADAHAAERGRGRSAKQEQEVGRRPRAGGAAGDGGRQGARGAHQRGREGQGADGLHPAPAVPSPPGMPEGVTLRDDPMTKTQAFLTQDPELL
ncbi:unnamed protein product, partial [Heterosigma akashiwo]